MPTAQSSSVGAEYGIEQIMRQRVDSGLVRSWSIRCFTDFHEIGVDGREFENMKEVVGRHEPGATVHDGPTPFLHLHCTIPP